MERATHERMRHALSPFASLFVGALLLAGCASSSQEPATSQDASSAGQSTTSDAATENDTANVAIDEEIRKACGLSQSEAHFAYNSSRLKKGDSDVLAKLAGCFTEGPLKGRTMALVGRADPRGEQEYNLALGGRRADSVRSAMVAQRLPAERVTATSRGALDAVGHDEAGWAVDRRVDVLLGK